MDNDSKKSSFAPKVVGGVPRLGFDEKGTSSWSSDMKKKVNIIRSYDMKKKVLPENSKTLYANNLNHPIGRMLVEADIVEFFRDVGKVVKVEIQLVPNNLSMIDFAKIEFESHGVAKKALEMKALHHLFGIPVQLSSREPLSFEIQNWLFKGM